LAKLASDITDATLLCERCGYVLEGLDERGACPECGQKIAESLPSRRMGTPFQIAPGWRGFVKQCAMLLRQPKELFGRMEVVNNSNPLLFVWATGLAALSLIAPIGAIAVFDNDDIELRIAAVLMPLVLWMPALFAFMFLVWLERIGVVFFSRKRGWRVSKPLAQAICANAAPGWIAAGVLMHLGLGLMLLIHRVMYDFPRTWWPWVETAAAAMPVLGFIAGMLIFETLVYIGVRRCKYANWLPRPQVQPEPRPGESTAPD